MVVALDVSDLDAAETLARTLEGTAGLLKVGLELFAAHGPASVERVRAFAPVFLDLKLHDIPTTVEHAARNAARLGIDMLTVHALGGEAMVAAAVPSVRRRARGPPHARGRRGDGAVEPCRGRPRVPASLAFEAVSAGASGVVVSGDDVSDVRDVVGEDAIPSSRASAPPARTVTTRCGSSRRRKRSNAARTTSSWAVRSLSRAIRRRSRARILASVR